MQNLIRFFHNNSDRHADTFLIGFKYSLLVIHP